MTRPNQPSDIWKYVEPEPNSGCWLWIGGGTTGRSGYARWTISGKKVLAHRAVYEIERGPIAASMTLDHLCRIRICVRPAHLGPVPWLTNVKRGGNSLKTHCPLGHEYDKFQVTERHGGGFRYCSTCDNARSLRRYYERQEAKS